MSMFLRWNVLIAAGILAVGIAEPSAQAPTMTMKVVMREKLGNAQQLLGAVIAADYEAIERYANSLSRISETEIASWQAVSKPDYTQNVTFFLLSVQGLREAGAKKDIEAARQEYTNLVSSCIRCHTLVRNARTASIER